jgi:hypothetical protein
MKSRRSTAIQQDDPSLRDHIKVVRSAAEFVDRALKNAQVVSLDLSANFKGYRRAVDELIALVQVAR